MKELRYLKLTSIAVVLLWSFLLAGFWYYDITLARHHMEELARNEAHANFETNEALRLWVVSHGGVYVPIDDKTPPNPALAHLPERDIQTPSGKKLTLMNSAYVLRQILAEFGEVYGVKGKLSSMQPLNPNNVPDHWESEALHLFESGSKEVTEFTDIDGEPYLRLMRVMLVQESCLKCHGFQNYKVGEVRGGFSLSVPMRPYLDGLKTTLYQKSAIYAAIWLTGMLGIISWNRYTARRLREKSAIEAKLQQQHLAIERANAELTSFANISAHHLMEPARRLLSYTQRLRTRLDGQVQDEEVSLCLQYLEQSGARMRDLIRDIERYLAAGTARGPLKFIDPAAVIREVQRRLSKLIIDRSAEIEVRSLEPIYLDLPRLIDLFEVLLSNALIHSSNDRPSRTMISAEVLHKAVRVRIEDNGPGIAVEYIERVFGVFEQLKPNPMAGTGIGLAIAKAIVESRGGKIWIEASTLGGTAVVFDLPSGGDVS